MCGDECVALCVHQNLQAPAFHTEGIVLFNDAADWLAELVEHVVAGGCAQIVGVCNGRTADGQRETAALGNTVGLHVGDGGGVGIGAVTVVGGGPFGLDALHATEPVDVAIVGSQFIIDILLAHLCTQHQVVVVDGVDE